MRARAAIAAALASALSACGGAADGPGEGRDDGMLATHPYEEGMDEPMAMIVGVLARDGTCFAVETAGKRYPASFPDGISVWDEAAGTLTVGGTALRVGDRFSANGAYVSADAGAGGDSCPPGERVRIGSQVERLGG